MELKDFKNTIATMIKNCLQELYSLSDINVNVEVSKVRENGDLNTNVSMTIARIVKKSPFLIATEVVGKLKEKQLNVAEIKAVQPGFINFFLDWSKFFTTIDNCINLKSNYGNQKSNFTKVNIEFVSANPTGDLHIGHARGAAYGDSLANIMTKVGYDVVKEYYINDAGNQIHNLALSIKARYKQLFDNNAEVPTDGYLGVELKNIAQMLKNKHGNKIPDMETIKRFGLSFLMNKIKEDLKKYRVAFDSFFSEQSLYPKAIISVLNELHEKNYTYTKDDAIWLKSSTFFDEKDRVIVTSDKRHTYLLPDIAYHITKYERGFTQIIDVLGADHHGYLPRLQSALKMLGYDVNKLYFEITQMVRVFKNNEEIKMSKRSGKAIGLLDLIEEVGVDPLRYFFVSRNLNTPMDLDLDLALKKTNENPVYYAQYAHARICSLLKKANREIVSVTTYEHLNENSFPLILLISSYSEILLECAEKKIPHKLTNYIKTLAASFHTYYSKEQIITSDEYETNEKLRLIKAVQIVLSDALNLIGVVAPKEM